MRHTILLSLSLSMVAPAAVAADPHGEAKAVIAAQCSACHRVPGVPDATGDIGPSLKGIGARKLLAGKLANNPANMTRWILHPQKVVPGSTMPETGLTPAQARKIAAYLATLTKP